MSKNEKISEEQFFESGKVIKNGVEWPETTPVELPIGYAHPPTISEMLAQMVRQELQMREEMDPEKEVEREEDFAMDEDGEEELLTPGELHYMAAMEREALVGSIVPPAKPAAGRDRSGGKEQKKGSGAEVEKGDGHEREVRVERQGGGGERVGVVRDDVGGKPSVLE